MKTFKLFSMALFALSLLVFNSCGKDDEESEIPQSTWQTVTINGKNFYNCTEAAIRRASSYTEKKIYDGQGSSITEIDGVNFKIAMYDEQTIEARGIATISIDIPATAFQNGSTLNGDIINMSIMTTASKMWNWGVNSRKIVVNSGSVSLVGIGNGKATVKFDNFNATNGKEAVTINGYATCEKN